jgi:peptidoglycan hydrolase-like protein with peptidoglycan-binding domain
MNLQDRELARGMTGEDVGLLQAELQTLGFVIAAEEIDQQLFGLTTVEAVIAFQEQENLEPTGVVDEITARAINAAVDALQPERFVVRGQVRLQDGSPLPDVIVRTADRDLRSEEPLGGAVTDANGRYEITYTADQFARAEKGTADLIVRAFDNTGQELAASETLFNAPQVAEIDLVVLPQPEPELSEFERLLAELAPILEDVEPAELTEEDIDFLVGETGLERSRLELLAEAGRLAQETDLPPEAFYGWGRLDFSLELESLLDQDPQVLREALERAIAERIIPASLGESVDEIMERLEQLRLDVGLDEIFEFFGGLHDEQTGDALAGFTVQAFDLDAGPELQALGHDISNADGLFLITYTAPRLSRTDDEDEEPDNTRRLQLHILNEQGEEIHQAVIQVTPGLEEVTAIPVPVPEVPDTSATLAELDETLDLELPPELLSHLAENGINSLDDIRRLGGLGRLSGLPVAADHPAVSLLEAHASLSTLSPNVALNARLIDGGLTSVAAVANQPRARFVSDFHTDAGGDLKTALLHAEAVASTKFLDTVATGVIADFANGYAAPLPGVDPAVSDAFATKCACKACESAVSPLAYLADLLDYAVTHLRIENGGQVEPVSLDFLSEQLHQPFGELPASCQTVENEVRQARVCIEVLRRFLGPRPLPDTAREEALARAEGDYTFAAYQALLGAIGTSYEELRQAHAVAPDTRQSLADRLGIAIEHLDDLLLDPGAITEMDLERLFGLVDTSRDVLSQGAKLGDAQEQISRWNLNGVVWNRHTSPDGTIYVRLTGAPAGNIVTVELFRDQERIELVASGERPLGGNAPVVVVAEDSSDFSGRFEIDFLAVTDDIEIVAVPHFLSARLQRLRQLWFEQDWPDPLPEDAYLLIDPDLIGLADLAYLAEDEAAFALWQVRRQEIDDLLADIRAERETDGLPAVVESQIGESLTELRLLRDQLQEGQDIEEQVIALGLQLPALLRLLEIADLIDAGATALESELEEVDSILAQTQKVALLPAWIAQEIQAGVTLSPDHFRIASEEPEELPLWRATRRQRRDWRDRLQARIDQERMAVESLRQAVDATEEATLPALRDALVMAADVDGANLDAKAGKISRNLLIDARTDGCQRTTRIAQAIETIQGLFWSVQTGVLPDALADIQLDADNFYEEWEWLGSYETWRAAMFVFLYPENVLLPMLRNRQTPGFRRLIEALRNQNRLTPEQACDAAREYADHFGDVCSMKVEASCQADTRIHRGEGCRAQTAVEYRYLAYHFGRGSVTSKVYWLTFDLQERCGDAQSYWEQVPGLYNVNAIIGAVPYRISEEERYICLFARTLEGGEQKLKLTRYHLEEGRWDDEPVELGLPPTARPPITAVIGQRLTEFGPPHLAIRGGGGTIYDRRLNREATDWADNDAMDDGENEGEWRVLVSRSKGREFQRLWAMVEMSAEDFYLLVQERGGYIRYRLFGSKDDGYWKILSQTRKGEPVGAFHFAVNQLYVVWKKTTQQEVFMAAHSGLSPSGLPPDFFVGPKTTTYYQRVSFSDSERTRSKESKDFNQFDGWLRDVVGLRLRDQTVSIDDGPEITLFDLFTDTPPPAAGDAAVNRYKRDVKRVIDALEAKIRNGEMGRDWSIADVLVRRLSNAKSLADTLRELFNNRTIKFYARSDVRSQVFTLSAGLDYIAPGVTASPRAGSVGQRLATQYREGQVGAYQSQFRGVGTSGQLREIARDRLVPRCTGPMEITERLTDEQRGLRRSLIRKAFLDNKDAPPSHLTYLEEAYYFVPVHLALQLQRRGQYQAALDWFRTVYDFSKPEAACKIYYGLVQEEDLSQVYKRARNWLSDPLNPHAIAEIRANTYTRFTILSLVRCLLEFGDAEFSRDTAESVARARSLYMTGLELLDTVAVRQQFSPCETTIEELDGEFAESIALTAPEWKPIWDEIILELNRIENRKTLDKVVDEIRSVMSTGEPVASLLLNARKVVVDALQALPPPTSLAEALNRKGKTTTGIHTDLMVAPWVLGPMRDAGGCAKNDILVAIAAASTADMAKLEEQNPALPWLRQPLAIASASVATAPASITVISGDGRLARFNPIAPSRSTIVAETFRAAPLQAIKAVKQVVWPWIPALYAGFCVPPNPIIASLRLHAGLNLYKIRTCRNIAGDERQLEPYAAPVDVESGLPTIGASGQISLPGTLVFRPTPYRYSTLIERAKQIVGLAQQIEATFLSALEKRDAEFYQLLRARQEIRLANAGVRLQDLRVREAEHGVQLAELQLERAQIQRVHYDRIINDIVAAQVRQAVLGMISTLAAAASPTGGFAAFAGGLSSLAGGISSLERERLQAELNRALAEQDTRIASLQINVARDHVRVVGQERRIAEIQAEHADVTAEFLANKFTNAELYEWMGQILEGVYGFFLQQATAVARLAENQLAFERQQLPPAFIQSDYWEAPLGMEVGGITDGSSPDRRGLTGSARLLQDIFQLDQYAFETDRRKLQLTKTLSLARLAPAEFQRFRESGVLRFNTPLEMFDGDFPGHYLRLIKSVRTSVIALIPPTEGIKATLSTTGISRVVIDSGGTFQTTAVRRPPESVALSSPINATGLFELTPQTGEMLLPFEGMGVDTAWEFQMPKAANQFDYRTIADVLLTIEYTALNSFDYRRQVIQELDDTISADRPFSFRQEFADAWYDLNHPELIDSPDEQMIVTFETRREDFPPNINELRIQHVVLFYARKEGSPFEVTAGLTFTRVGGSPVGGSATTNDGIASTRRGNAPSWNGMIGATPVGTWRLDLTADLLGDSRSVNEVIRDEDIEDILFVITYQGRTPAWPA